MAFVRPSPTRTYVRQTTTLNLVFFVFLCQLYATFTLSRLSGQSVLQSSTWRKRSTALFLIVHVHSDRCRMLAVLDSSTGRAVSNWGRACCLTSQSSLST